MERIAVRCSEAFVQHHRSVDTIDAQPLGLAQCRHIADGPLADVPVAGCLGDQMAAMLGQRCRINCAKNTYGTGCFVLLNTGAQPVPSAHGLLTTMAFQPGPDAEPHYALEGGSALAFLFGK